MKKLRNLIKSKREKQQMRSDRVRKKLISTTDKPRMAVYRSNNYIYVQIIDDSRWHTVVASSDLKLKKWTKTDRATKVWEMIAKKAIEAGVKEIAFDRNWYKYTGRVKALAEAARKSGLKF